MVRPPLRRIYHVKPTQVLLAGLGLIAFGVAAPAQTVDAPSAPIRSFAQPSLMQLSQQQVRIEPVPSAPVVEQTLPAVTEPKARVGKAKALPTRSERAATTAQSTAAPIPDVAPVTPAARQPELPPKADATWPKVLPAKEADANPAKADVFSAEEVAAGRARCVAMLKGLDVVVVDEVPMKSGACGTAAPVQLISVGKNPQVALSPPATMTCDMVAALHKWVTDDIQPLARKHLGSAVIGMETMSSYSCRNAYGRKRGQLSEHGKANAVDIRGFATADAKGTYLLADWGPTGWEIRAQIAAAQAAAKVAAEKAAAEKVALEKAASAAKAQALAAKQQPGPANGVTPGSAAAGPPTPGTVGTIIEGLPAITNRLPGAGPAAEGRNGYGLMKPSQLGGPKAAVEKSAPPAGGAPVMLPADAVTHSRKARFLREAHTAACKIFGTTLGPETNLAHKNHFHLDMAERSRGNFCE